MQLGASGLRNHLVAWWVEESRLCKPYMMGKEQRGTGFCMEIRVGSILSMGETSFSSTSVRCCEAVQWPLLCLLP